MGKSAIVVEDNIIPSLSLQAMLAKKGYTVTGAFTNGEKSISFIKENPPDVLLLDIRLIGNMNGLEVASEVRKFSKCPIIFISALTDPETVTEASAISNSQMVSKPYTELSIEKALAKALL